MRVFTAVGLFEAPGGRAGSGLDALSAGVLSVSGLRLDGPGWHRGWDAQDGFGSKLGARVLRC